MSKPAVIMEEQIMTDIPGREELPEQYGRLGFCRAYIYRCYQKNRRRNPPEKRDRKWIYRMKNVSW